MKTVSINQMTKPIKAVSSLSRIYDVTVVLTSNEHWLTQVNAVTIQLPSCRIKVIHGIKRNPS